MSDEIPAPELGLVLDCLDPGALAPFWAAALDYVVVGEVGVYIALYPRDRSGPKLLLQRVDEERAGKNRVHLDLEVDDIEALAARLVGMGATRTRDEPFDEHGHRWITLADPEGNELCVCQC